MVFIRGHYFVSLSLKNADVRWKSRGPSCVGQLTCLVAQVELLRWWSRVGMCSWCPLGLSEPVLSCTLSQVPQKGTTGVLHPSRPPSCGAAARTARSTLGILAVGPEVCIDEALHDGFIFLAVLICFLFLCSAAKSWPFISFFYPQRISCN